MMFRLILTIFILIFTILAGDSKQDEIQLVTFHKKTNGLLIRVVVSQTPKSGNIAGWVGQENWFYLTINNSFLKKGVLDSLIAKPPILEIEGIQNNQSSQIGFLFEHQITDYQIFHSPSSRVFLVHIWKDLNSNNINNIIASEKNNLEKVFSIPSKESTGKSFYESFVQAREKYGPEKYFVWYNNWYSTEETNKTDPNEIDYEIESLKLIESKSNLILSIPEFDQYGPPVPDNLISKLKNKPSKIQKEILEKKLKSEVEKYNKVKSNTASISTYNKSKKINTSIKNDSKKKKNKFRRKKTKILDETDKKVVDNKNLQLRYDIIPDLVAGRKTYLKIACDLTGMNIILDGKMIGKTPLAKRIPISPGWHRVKIDIPGSPKFNQSGIPITDHRDIYVTGGRTQKVTFKLLKEQQNNLD